MTEHDRDDQPVDFSALGPPLAADRFDELVAAVAHRGADELARRANSDGVIGIVFAWRRPVLALSALAAAAAILLIVRNPVQSAQLAELRGPATVAEAIGIPAAYAYDVERASRADTRPTERP